MNSTAETTFGKSLRLAREAKQLTQTQLAKIVGTSQQNIAGIEAGRSLPKDDLFDKLVEVFGRHSAVAQLPPRGVIKFGYDTVEDIRVKSAAVPQTTPNGYCDKLTALFNRLPDDEVIQAMAFSQCAQVLFALLSPAPTQALLTAPERARQRE